MNKSSIRRAYRIAYVVNRKLEHSGLSVDDVSLLANHCIELNKNMKIRKAINNVMEIANILIREK